MRHETSRDPQLDLPIRERRAISVRGRDGEGGLEPAMQVIEVGANPRPGQVQLTGDLLGREPCGMPECEHSAVLAGQVREDVGEDRVASRVRRHGVRWTYAITQSHGPWRTGPSLGFPGHPAQEACPRLRYRAQRVHLSLGPGPGGEDGAVRARRVAGDGEGNAAQIAVVGRYQRGQAVGLGPARRRPVRQLRIHVPPRSVTAQRCPGALSHRPSPGAAGRVVPRCCYAAGTASSRLISARKRRPAGLRPSHSRYPRSVWAISSSLHPS